LGDVVVVQVVASEWGLELLMDWRSIGYSEGVVLFRERVEMLLEFGHIEMDESLFHVLSRAWDIALYVILDTFFELVNLYYFSISPKTAFLWEESCWEESRSYDPGPGVLFKSFR
jgi:hypothetical protein